MDLAKSINILVKEELESLLEKKGGFRFDIFRSLPSGQKMFQYAKKYLPFLQKGTERATFAWKAGKVLKISFQNTDATDTDTNNQNKIEIDVLSSGRYREILPKIYDFDPYYNWLIVEGVKVIADNQELKKHFQTIMKIQDLMPELERRAISEDDPSVEVAIKEALKTISRYVFNDEKIDKVIAGLTDLEMEILENIFIYAPRGFDDITRLDHWGITSTGRLVLADAGLSDLALE